jgi:5-methylcytosine-specific restriction endonuclease McrA
MSDWELRRVAHHEAGHAVMAYLLGRALPGNSRRELHKLKSWSRRPARPDLDSAWDRLSLRRRNAFPICEVPGCSRPSESTDHIVPAFEGGTSEWGNLQALCREHHQEKTVAESHRAAKREAAARKASARGFESDTIGGRSNRDQSPTHEPESQRIPSLQANASQRSPLLLGNRQLKL